MRHRTAKEVSQRMGMTPRIGAQVTYSDYTLEEMGEHVDHVVKGELVRYIAQALVDIAQYEKVPNRYMKEVDFRTEMVFFTPEQFDEFCLNFEIAIRQSEWNLYRRMEIKAKELSKLEADGHGSETD